MLLDDSTDAWRSLSSLLFQSSLVEFENTDVPSASFSLNRTYTAKFLGFLHRTLGGAVMNELSIHY